MKKTFVAIGALMAVVVLGTFLGCNPKDVTPPQISIEVRATDSYESSIDGNVIQGVVEIVATVTDNVGVDTVRFFIGDSIQIGPHYNEPNDTVNGVYVYKWKVFELVRDSLDIGLEYTISAKAWDGAGNEGVSGSQTFVVTIDNQAPESPYMMDPEDDDTVNLASTILKWQGNDLDSFPIQELVYKVYFGEGSAGNMDSVYSTKKGTVPDIGNWATPLWDRDITYLKPETDYYWKVVVTDPYGQLTESEIYHFERGPNGIPGYPKVTPSFDSFGAVIDMPEDGAFKLTWASTDPNGDALTHFVYFAPEDEVDITDEVFVYELGSAKDTLLAAAEYTVQVSAGVKYYWRPISTDFWGATPPFAASEDSIAAWSFTVAEED